MPLPVGGGSITITGGGGGGGAPLSAALLSAGRLTTDLSDIVVTGDDQIDLDSVDGIEVGAYVIMPSDNSVHAVTAVSGHLVTIDPVAAADESDGDTVIIVPMAGVSASRNIGINRTRFNLRMWAELPHTNGTTYRSMSHGMYQSTGNAHYYSIQGAWWYTDTVQELAVCPVGLLHRGADEGTLDGDSFYLDYTPATGLLSFRRAGTAPTTPATTPIVNSILISGY